ncbi:hypothetical protein G9A89_001395 [Geosiphon pyriformis]|nr:hypothetical protein G9A89_001395 [Geosiphon pyriformis]
MATAYAAHIRPITHPKRVKLVSTCDNCKNRKVRCDKTRPSCGACTKTARTCSYTYSAISEWLRESGGAGTGARARQMQEKLNNLQTTQERRIDQTQNFISMVLRGTGMPARSDMGVQKPPTDEVEYVPVTENQDGLFPPSNNQDLAHSVLQHSTEIASRIPRNYEQCQYDPTYFLNSVDFAVLAQQVPPTLSIPSPPLSYKSESNQSRSSEKMRIEELASALEDLNIYQSTRYIGEGSLLLLGDEDDNGEKFIPQGDQDLSAVRESLKYLPDPDTVNCLIFLYYQHLHRYAPFLRKEVVRNALQNLSKPQHLLLLNCIFFAASPFHEDPQRRDGRVYFDRAEALLFEYCRTQPHVLTVIATVILGRHNKQPVSEWMYNGIATKMLFELGLHRTMKNIKIKMVKEVARMRNEAFWMTFISENFISAAYGRPNMIEENDCDVEVPELPADLNPIDEDSRLHIAFIYWTMLSRICVRVRKYLYATTRMKFLVQEDENRSRILDAQLGNWFQSLPQWLTFQEMSQDLEGSLLNGIGGDLHLFFYTVLILLHSRHLKTQGGFVDYAIYPSNAPTTCTQAAKIIVTWLDILLSNVPEFFAHSVCGPFAINPAMRVFRWNAEYAFDTNDSIAREAAMGMIEHLNSIKNRITEISRQYDRGRQNEDNPLGYHSHSFMLNGLLGNENPDSDEGLDISSREEEVYIADDDFALRSQFRRIAWKQQSYIFNKRRLTRGYSGSSTGSPSRQMSWASTSGGSGPTRQMSWTTSIAGTTRKMSSNSFKVYNNRWDPSFQLSQPLNEEPQSFSESPKDGDFNFTFITEKRIEFPVYEPSPDQIEIERRQKAEQELFSPDPEPTSYISPQLSSSIYSPLLDGSIVSSSPPPNKPSQTRYQLDETQHRIIRSQDHNSEDNNPFYEFSYAQLPMTPPHQNYSKDTPNMNFLNDNDSLNSIIWSSSAQVRNPLRTASNTSSTSAMLTPPLGPNDEQLNGPSLDDLAGDGFWDTFKNDSLVNNDNEDPLGKSVDSYIGGGNLAGKKVT